MNRIDYRDAFNYLSSGRIYLFIIEEGFGECKTDWHISRHEIILDDLRSSTLEIKSKCGEVYTAPESSIRFYDLNIGEFWDMGDKKCKEKEICQVCKDNSIKKVCEWS